MHELPKAFHFWSHHYIRPALLDVFGVDSIVGFYGDGLKLAFSRDEQKEKRILSIGAVTARLRSKLQNYSSSIALQISVSWPSIFPPFF